MKRLEIYSHTHRLQAVAVVAPGLLWLAVRTAALNCLLWNRLSLFTWCCWFHHGCLYLRQTIYGINNHNDCYAALLTKKGYSLGWVNPVHSHLYPDWHFDPIDWVSWSIGRWPSWHWMTRRRLSLCRRGSPLRPHWCPCLCCLCPDTSRRIGRYCTIRPSRGCPGRNCVALKRRVRVCCGGSQSVTAGVGRTRLIVWTWRICSLTSSCLSGAMPGYFPLQCGA